MNPNILNLIFSDFQQHQQQRQMKPIIEMVEITPNVFAKLGTKMTTETPVTTAAVVADPRPTDTTQVTT